MDTIARTKRGRGSKLLRWGLLLAILLLAAFLRLYRLDVTPPGFHYDEAFNALQARDVLNGANRPVFFTGNFGEEPMQMYVEAAVFAVAGQSPWSARLSNVILGLLLVPALYFAGRALFPDRPIVALLASFVAATSYWSINFSRLGIETNSLPWILTLSAGALATAESKRDRKWGIAAGILVGATVYTYLASRLWPVAVALWAGYLLISHRAEMGVRLRIWMLVAAAAVLVAAPLLIFFIANPLAVTGRSGQVLNPTQLGANLVKTAAMYFLAGDTDPRDNLPGRAALDPFLALLFFIGIVVSIARARRREYAFILIWLLVMSLPSALTDFAPNFRRAIGALPSLALVCGVGAEWVWSLRRARVFSRGGSLAVTWLLSLSLIAGFASSAYSSTHDYFEVWAGDPGLFYSFDAGLLNIGQLFASRPRGEQLCLSPDYYDHPTLLWALNSRPFASFDGRRVAVLPNSALPATCAIITYEDQTFSLPDFIPRSERLTTIYDLTGKEYARVLYLPAGAVPKISPQYKIDASVGQVVRVAGYDLARSGTRIDLRVYWQPDRALDKDYTVFVHLLDASGSRLLSQDDTQPGRGTYPTSRWQGGETIIDRYELGMPPDMAPRPLQIELGMYLLSTQARLPIWIDGQEAEGDRLLIAVPNH